MVFSSSIFIFIFLPIVIGIYYIILNHKRSAQNIFLCIMSLLFYAWGEPKFVFVMLFSIFVNWCAGLLVEKYRGSAASKLVLAADVVFNITVIFIFKYLNFTVENINLLINAGIRIPEIMLPIGISFFTFQAISYVADVYRGNGRAQKNLVNVALYISFFPQLIAGPIVRYETVAKQIMNRRESFDVFSEGVSRFIIGLGKKVIIANNMAIIADAAFGIMETGKWLGDDVSLAASAAWLGAIAYTFQIFFDFSGYSDMAIGLGKMFGFHFLENFNYPYISSSVTEFWRRWHISLSSWFRDYVYIPLGGSRVKSQSRHIFNLLVVWLCTGIWHGANWTFIAWGMMYFVLLVFEKFVLTKISLPKPLGRIYSMFFVVIGWVLFRADSISQAIEYISKMFAIGSGDSGIGVFYFGQYGIFLLAAAVLSTPVVPKLGAVLKKKLPVLADIASVILHLLILAVSISFVVKGSYNPFIYFNF